MTDGPPDPDGASTPDSRPDPGSDDVEGGLRSADPAGDEELAPVVPAGPVRDRRRLAELGAVAGVVAVMLAFVGAAMALGRDDDPGDAPGLPAPYETAAGGTGQPPGPVTTTGTSAAPGPTSSPQRPSATWVPVPGRTVYPSSTVSLTTAPAPTTSRASATASPRPGPSTPAPTATTASPSPSASATTPTDPGDPTDPEEPTDPPTDPPPVPGTP
jgi:hypothetical protein